jgi:transcriptional regulator with XRE-family HTH domain
MNEIKLNMTPAEILEARQQLGLTQAQMAPLLGYSNVARVSEIERGVRKPGAAVVRLLHAYLEGYRPENWPVRQQNTEQSGGDTCAADQID